MRRTLVTLSILISLGARAEDGGRPLGKPLSITFAGDVTLGFHHEEYFDEQVKKGRSRDEMFA